MGSQNIFLGEFLFIFFAELFRNFVSSILELWTVGVGVGTMVLGSYRTNKRICQNSESGGGGWNCAEPDEGVPPPPPIATDKRRWDTGVGRWVGGWVNGWRRFRGQPTSFYVRTSSQHSTRAKGWSHTRDRNKSELNPGAWNKTDVQDDKLMWKKVLPYRPDPPPTL